MRTLLDAMPDGVLADRDGFVVYANQAAQRALGYQAERELFWRPTTDLMHPSERERMRTWLVEDGVDHHIAEVRLVRRTGEAVPFELRHVRSELDGEPASLLIVRDLSERRRMEKQLQFADRMASLGTLSAGVAHEINNPLTYILANLDILGELVEDDGILNAQDTLDELRELIAETRDGALRVQTVVRDLKSFARPTRDVSIGRVSLPQVVESVVRMAMSQIKNRAELVVEIGDTPPVRANPNQLHQVLLNLLVNAAQAIEMGSVRANQIRISTGVAANGHVLIEVSDTGCGIDAASLARVFDPFYTTKDQGEGSGLGLWICHSLISQLGGEITVDSIVGRGSTFRVTLPAAAPSP